MSQEIEWHPEYVAQAAKKADDSGESATKTRLSSIPAAGSSQEILDSLIGEMNNLADQIAFAAAGISHAVTEVNQAFIRVEADNQDMAKSAILSSGNNH